MKKFMKKCKRALVVALAIALVGTSVDMSMLYAQAEETPGVVSDVNGNDLQDNVSGGDAQNGTEAGTSEANGSQNNREDGGETVEYASIEPAWYELPAVETSAMPMGFFSLQDGVVALKSINEEEWIERLDLSGDATVIRDFYDKLGEWTDNDGIEDWLITGEKANYTIATLSGTVENAEQMEMDEIGTAVSEIVSTAVYGYGKYITAAVNAFDRDYPEVFWLTGRVSYGSGAGRYNSIGEYSIPIVVNLCDTSFDMRAAAYRDEATIKNAITTMNANANSIVNAAEGKSVVEKIRYFNEQLTHKNEYNTSSDLNNIAHECRECTSALAGATGTNGPVCEGYARAFKVLCDKADIPCVLVDGKAKNSTSSTGEAHMWNYVQVDRKWYGVDVTWNDPKFTYNGVVQGGAESGGENENWLLVGSDTIIKEMKFIESHPMENQVSSNGVAFINGPELSAEKYVVSNDVASVMTSTGEVKFESFDEAFNVANGAGQGATLKLLKSVVWEDNCYVTGNFTLDLNGYSLDFDDNVMGVRAGGSLTISDSSDSKSGKVSGSGYKLISVDGKTDSAVAGVLTITGGTFTIIDGSWYVIENAGTVKVTGGTISSTTQSRYTIHSEEGEVIVEGGKVTHAGSSGYAIYSTKGKVTVTKEGQVTNTGTYGYALYSAEGEVTISGGKVTHTGTSGNAVRDNMGKVTVTNGGEVTATGYAIYSYIGEVIISGGKVANIESEDETIRVDRGAVTISGGTIEGSTEAATVMIWGTETSPASLKISGGSVSNTGTGSAINVYKEYDSAVITGGTISVSDSASKCVENHGSVTLSNASVLRGGNAAVTNGGTFTINGGTIENANAYTIYNNTGTLLLNEGNIENTGADGIGVFNGADASVVMTGGTVKVAGSKSAIYNNKGSVTISGISQIINTGSAPAILQYGEKLYLSGGATITGGGSAEDIKIERYNNIGEDYLNSKIQLIGALTNITPYSVSYMDAEKNTTGVFAVGSANPNGLTTTIYTITADDAAKFTSADTNLLVKQDTVNNQLLLERKPHVYDFYLSNSLNGAENARVVEIRCANTEDCDWVSGDCSVTITAPENLVYDASPKEATLEDKITSNTQVASVSNIEYYVKNGSTWTAVSEAVDAGSYKAEVTVTMGSSTKKAAVAFKISKLSSEGYVQVTPSNAEYDPFSEDGVDAVKVLFSHSKLEETATIQYSTDGGNTWSENIPTMKTVGELEVAVKVTAPNFTEFNGTYTAVMTPYDISDCNVELEQSSYYYTGQQIKPVVTEITEGIDRKLPLTSADYEVSYGNNVSVGSSGAVYVEATNSNYTGIVQGDFSISHYDGTVKVLYNGAERRTGYYNADVAISAEGYTVSKTIDGTYTDSVLLSGEGVGVSMDVYFKQAGTGYITSAIAVSANIDKSAPSFAEEGMGILVAGKRWNTLADELSYNLFFKEAKTGTISATDTVSGIADYYYYFDKSGSTKVKTAAELDACAFVQLVNSSEISINADGKYVIYAYAVDNAGNQSDYICSNGIVIDTTAPVVEVTEPSESTGTLTDTTLTFAVEVNEDAVIGIYIETDYSGESLGTITHNNKISDWKEKESDKQLTTNDSGATCIHFKTTVTANQAKDITITGLTPNTYYEYSVEVYDMAENGTVVAGEEDTEDSGYYFLKGITTLKTVPTFDTEPTITGTYGQKLSEMTVSQPMSTNGVTGTWSIVYAGAGQMYDMPAVDGTTAYEVKFTPSNNNADQFESVIVEVIPTVAKLALTVTVDNQTKKYGEENPELTYTITEGSIVDANYAGRPKLTIALSTTATKTSDVGTYNITGTVTNDANYDVTVKKGTLTIEQAEAVITVEAGKNTYSKTFGDNSFVLSGISTNSDGKISYSVNNDVVSVDAAGKVTINGAGVAVITLSVEATQNYKTAGSVEITVNVAKATVADRSIEKSYLYLKDTQESIILADYVPQKAENVAYQVGEATGKCEFVEEPAVGNGKLSYIVKAGELNASSSFVVTVSSDNYENFKLQVTITLVEQTPIEEMTGSEVSLKNNTLTYGQALSTLEFNEAVFVVEGTSQVVVGTLAWENPDDQPDVATTKATWVFTPDSSEYMEATGEIDIVVKKAVQPEFYIDDLGTMEYFPGGAERTPVTTTGGVEGGEVTITVPVDNGVIRLDTDNCFAILSAGTVTFTAVCIDPEGNYEDATATYKLTVLPYELEAGQIEWYTGVTGEEVYTGNAKEPSIWVYMISGPLAEGTDYTVTYVNNTEVYTLTEADEGFDAAKAPAVVVIGKGNYAGTVKKYFVINKAEAEIDVAEGLASYTKTYGDEAFTLSGITKKGEGSLTYTVADSKNVTGMAVAQDQVITVDAMGKITIVGAGTANIVVSMAETDNYKAAEDVVIAVTVAQATYTTDVIEKHYAYNKANTESITLAEKVPVDAGTVSYQIQSTEGDISFTQAAVVDAEGMLTYTLAKGSKGQRGKVTVLVSSDNYKEFYVTVELELSLEVLVELKAGSEVTAVGELTYGDALSKLTFGEAVFVEEGTDIVVAGTLSWETPDSIPEVTTTTAKWVFTPNNADYAPVTGTTTIKVNKAVQPTLSIVPVTNATYGQEDSIWLETTGGLEGAEITITVPTDNGVVTAVNTNGLGQFFVVPMAAGKVTVTAVAATGNYEDAVATYELTVAPATLEDVSWAGEFTGEDTYNGNAITPAVQAYFIAAGILTEGTDYTVKYVNNTNAYTLAADDADFDAAKAPAVVVTGKGNYTGTVTLYFVINKAENAPNMPSNTRTVANSTAIAGQVSLPEGWIWQEPSTTLAEGTETVAIAIYDGTDKGNYEKEAVAVTITRLAVGLPYVAEINGEAVSVIKAGWNHVGDDLDAAVAGDVITVDMNGATVLPGNVIDNIKGKDITLILDMGNDITWTINGKSITADTVADVDLKVDLNTANIPVDVVNKITGEIYTMQISLAHNGKFGYTATLTINLEAKNAGYYAQLFHYEETAKDLKFVVEKIIDAEGNVALPFTHASDYTIVIDDEQYKETSNDNNNNDNNNNNNDSNNGSGSSTPAPIPTPAPAAPSTPKSPQTGDTFPMESMMLWMTLALVTVGFGSVYGRRKNIK